MEAEETHGVLRSLHVGIEPDTNYVLSILSTVVVVHELSNCGLSRIWRQARDLKDMHFFFSTFFGS